MEILENGKYSHLVIRNVLDKYNYMDARDKAFVKRVTEGTLERLIQIDYVLDQFSKVSVLKMKPLIRNLMRLSVYQLLFMDQIPDSAVCNEAVKLAGKRGFRGLSGFVNGVLRNIARNREHIEYPNPERDRRRALSIQYSMPEWLIGFWEDAYGEAKTQAVLQGALKEHPVTVRLSSKTSEEERGRWLAELSKRKIHAERHPYHPLAYTLTGTDGVGNLPGYEEGLFVVQDVSSMLAVDAAGVEELENKSGELLVVDVCAAPGGKSLYMAEKLEGRGIVISRDLTEYKASLIRDNIKRMNVVNMTAEVWDAQTPDESLFEKADAVLADLPCSGLGIMGKKRDIKYRISREGLDELALLQRRILKASWRYVKPGGILIYSTCTMNPVENERMIEWFTGEHPFKCQSLAPYLPEELKEEEQDGKIQLFPGIHKSDGFFISRLVRTC
ncbi:MAG: 16S rRNA (cytosine(967)-C(5))-methyltransferase RsmB [Lachnospiraceae bacterium]|nr:16S rRNA (cytosine(967)-C(5))-methyltransferase RsmB [Lachnospiraceae bacterium]